MPSEGSLWALSETKTIDLMRIVAAVAVVLIHKKLLGEAGIATTTVARIMAPYFFGISGFFTIRLDANGLMRRCLAVLKIAVCGYVLCLLYGCIRSKVVTDIGIKACVAGTFSVRRLASRTFHC